MENIYDRHVTCFNPFEQFLFGHSSLLCVRLNIMVLEKHFILHLMLSCLLPIVYWVSKIKLLLRVSTQFILDHACKEYLETDNLCAPNICVNHILVVKYTLWWKKILWVLWDAGDWLYCANFQSYSVLVFAVLHLFCTSADSNFGIL